MLSCYCDVCGGMHISFHGYGSLLVPQCDVCGGMHIPFHGYGSHLVLQCIRGDTGTTCVLK
jgi:hypothetical protein